MLAGMLEVGKAFAGKDVDVAQAIDKLCAGLSGTAVAVIGWLLARMGWLRGKKDDEKEENFDKLQGYQDYSLQIGDVSATIDWAAPTALPLFTGAAVAELMEQDHWDIVNLSNSHKCLNIRVMRLSSKRIRKEYN